MRKLLPLLALALLLSQCRSKKNDPQPPTLPPITQNGSNTIGFLVDGKVWLPEGSFNFPSWKAYYSQRTFWFLANQVTKNGNEGFGIHINPIELRKGTHDLAQRYGVLASYNTLTDDFRVTAPGSGTLHISRLDSVQHIMAGTFEFEAVSATTGKTVHVTNGRFDLRTD